MYDPSSVTTITGNVLAVESIPGTGWGRGRRGPAHGVHLTLETTGADPTDVHVGPSWFLDGTGLMLAPNDVLEVRGSRVMLLGTPVVIAAEMQEGRSGGAVARRCRAAVVAGHEEVGPVGPEAGVLGPLGRGDEPRPRS